MKSKFRYTVLLILAIIIIILIFFMSKAFGKYIVLVDDARTISSTDFYFESNYDENTSSTVGWSGDNTKEIPLEVKNYHNTLLYTKENINYSISYNLTEGNSSNINISLVNDLNEVPTDSEELSGNTTSLNRYTLKVNPINVSKGETYKVSVTYSSVFPYTKQITNEFIIKVSNAGDYDTEFIESKNSEYVILKININKLENDLVIKYKDTFILDKTNITFGSYVESVSGDYNVITIDKASVSEKTVYKVEFIKNSSDADYNQDIIIE